MHWMDGWDWFWMTFMIGFWVVVLGVVVYVAVKLATRPTDRGGCEGAALHRPRSRLPADDDLDDARPRARWPSRQ